MTAMRVPSFTASFMLCVTKIIVVPSSWCKSRTNSCKEFREIGSRALKGSSIRIISGLAANALKIPIRCCSPPDNSLGIRWRYCSGSSLTCVSKRSTASERSFFDHPNISGITSIFCLTSIVGNRAICWRTYPICQRIFWILYSLIRFSLK